ncbi:GH25 family lysozyme [Aestuariivirga litoralis]|uniref:GH25 family lysozyme n=1 Tax=Aestuariivirga litoralis TaxID=2650924 RepID=UPI0018C64991|nr:GH25 family lysozyme [Aestuariivirga litoralis]
MKRFSRIVYRAILVLLLAAGAGLYFGWNYAGFFWLYSGVKGIDVSHHQGKIDWPLVAKSDIRFAYIKATEGGTFVDDQFVANWKAARDAGLFVGAYHFLTQCKTGEEQAKSFLAQLPKDADQLPPVLDAEKMESCSDGTTVIDVPKEVVAFLDKVEAEAGCRPLVYTDESFDQVYLSGLSASEKIWARSIGLPPFYRQRSWILWQYHDSAARPGIATPVDLNVFRGNNAEFQSFKASFKCFAKPT